MQFKRSPESPAAPIAAGGSHSPRYRRPQWLVDWIRNRGYYVILECGHWESFAEADTTLCLIKTFEGLEVHCIDCDGFCKVVNSLTLCEYMRIPSPVKVSKPQF